MTSETKKILIALTSRERLGESDKPTGYWLSEVTHFYEVLEEAGYEMVFVSPEGGEAPMDPNSREERDSANSTYLNDSEFMDGVTDTLEPEEVDPSEYIAIYYPGGHGPMWDIATDERIADIAREIYERNGVVAAVCHGPAGLLPIELTSGEPLLSGKTVTGVSNLEEWFTRKKKYMPFLLEDALEEKAERYTKSLLPSLANVEVTDRVVTGQNPRSASKVAERTLELLEETKDQRVERVVSS